MNNTSINQSEQENLLTLLIYDKESLPILSQNLDIELLESFLYRNIAKKALDFYAEFKKPIGNHLPDTLEDELNKKGEKSNSELYKEILNCLHENKNHVNREYVLKELDDFIRKQQLKLGIIEAAKLLDSGKVDEAELVLENSKKKQLNVFNPGTFLYDHENVLKFLNLSDNSIPTGIPELDRFGICPAPKELFALAGLSGRGKTWFFIHLARIALLLRKKVLIISLEMGESRMFQRYLQNIFAYAKREDEFEIPIFTKDGLGRLYGIEFEKVKPKGTFDNIKIARKELKQKLKKVRNQNLLIKEFPTRSLTIPKLKAYIENLINYTKFHPDLLLIDSPDNMYHDVKYKVDSLVNTFEDLRGIAGEYNLASCVVSQINKGGKNVSWLDEEFLTGAFAKMFIPDNFITFNQTDFEYECNLARLLVIKGRNDQKGQKILLSQNYAMGQFCLDSIMMTSKYKNILKDFNNEDSGIE